MKKLLASLLLSLLCTSVFAEQNNHSINPKPVAPEQIAVTTSNSTVATPQSATKPKPNSQTTINFFYRFVRVFLMVLTNQQVQSSIKGIEKLLATLMQAAYQVLQSNKPVNGIPVVAPAPNKSSLKIDPTLVEELSRSFSSHIKKTDLWRTPNHGNGKMDDQTKEILANFSGVVQNFFEILRDPENPETVPTHILGMLGGMVNIATVAMTKHSVSPDADYEELKAYAQSLDTEMKVNMYRIIRHAQEQSDYLAA